MNELATRLQNVNEAGSYGLNFPRDQLVAAVSQAKFVFFEADLSAVQNKNEFLSVVAQAIHAPDGFGNNWDALADVLSDLSWQAASGYVLLLLNGGEALGLPAADLEIANEIFTSTISSWKLQGRPFWIFRG